MSKLSEPRPPRREGGDPSKSCEQWFDSLSAWMDGAAVASEVEDLKTHLDHCRPCQGRYQEWMALRTLLPAAMEPVVSIEFAARTAEGIQKVRALERGRRPTPLFGGLARMLGGGLAWGLMGATCAALFAANAIQSLSGDSMASFTPSVLAELHRYALNAWYPPQWLFNWPVWTILLVATGLVTLRPWAFWRRVRDTEVLSPWEILSFGAGLLLVGMAGLVPATAEVGVLRWGIWGPSRDVAGNVVHCAGLWSGACLAITCMLLMLKTCRSLAKAAWIFVACILVCMALEPLIGPAVAPWLETPENGGTGVAMGLPSRAEQVDIQHLLQHMPDADPPWRLVPTAQFVPFANTVPLWSMVRLQTAAQLMSPGRWWWTLVGTFGGVLLLGGLLVGGPLHGDLHQPRAVPLIAGLALLLAGLPGAWWLTGTMARAHLTEPPLHHAVALEPHPDTVRTVVELGPLGAGPDNAEPVRAYPYPMPGLLEAMLQSPQLSSATEPGDYNTLQRRWLERTRAGLNWDSDGFLEAERQLLASEPGVDKSLGQVLMQLDLADPVALRRMSGFGDQSNVPRDYDLSTFAVHRLAQLQDLVRGRLHWSPVGSPPRQPALTLHGVVYIHGVPAADIPIRVWNMNTNNRRNGQVFDDTLIREPGRAIEACCGYLDPNCRFPLATRTDHTGRFELRDIPAGFLTPPVPPPTSYGSAIDSYAFPRIALEAENMTNSLALAILVPGRWDKAWRQTYTHAPWKKVSPQDTDVDLGRFDMTVSRSGKTKKDAVYLQLDGKP